MPWWEKGGSYRCRKTHVNASGALTPNKGEIYKEMKVKARGIGYWIPDAGYQLIRSFLHNQRPHQRKSAGTKIVLFVRNVVP